MRKTRVAIAFALFVSVTLAGGQEPGSSTPNPEIKALGPNDTFAAARLPAGEQRQIIKQVEGSAYDAADDWTSELRVRRVELGSSAGATRPATPGLVVQGRKLLCGGTGNCQLWVFRRSSRVETQWVSLFAKQPPVVDGFRLGPGVTGGIKDLTVTANSTAEATTTVTYRFDGKFYRVKH